MEGAKLIIKRKHYDDILPANDTLPDVPRQGIRLQETRCWRLAYLV